MESIAFFDTEVANQRITDIGAVRDDGSTFHSPSVSDFHDFIRNVSCLGGHNIIGFDLRYLPFSVSQKLIDTLYLSVLLYPEQRHHALGKEEKLSEEELNNPLSDSRKAFELFNEEVGTFISLDKELQKLYCGLLSDSRYFRGFFSFIGFDSKPDDLEESLRNILAGRICMHVNLKPLLQKSREALAYAVSLILHDCPLIPGWLYHAYPEIENVLTALRLTPCKEGCDYCRGVLDIHANLKKIFGYDSFRSFDGEPLQEKGVQAAVNGESLLCIFPTGGGKSLTFQLPALMAGRLTHGLTVVISPLQSLMKDQVDHLNEIGIVEAVTVNGLLDLLERKKALELVADGTASLLYISPEQLRSYTMTKILKERMITRFVIDEAHCFSSWGQDFRVDYLYIAKFIRELNKDIPVSCFTATAKPAVIKDIRDYFMKELNLDLKVFTASVERKNLHYRMIKADTDEEKYRILRALIIQHDCPAIVYVSRTKKAEKLAMQLGVDGIAAKAYHGQMDPAEKVAVQDGFLKNELRVIVATSAFGMGVDKKDIGLVVHFEISGSLEDYIQEAGRAGRDEHSDAECCVLYNENDLDKHFLLQNQTKVSLSEINAVWKAIKKLCRKRKTISCSPLEIARAAGWNTSVYGIETRAITAIAALEHAGYLERGKNVPQVFADSITARSVIEANEKIDASSVFGDEKEKTMAKRIIRSLITSRALSRTGVGEAESRVDYLAEMLGLSKQDVIRTVENMRSIGLLADYTDMSASVKGNGKEIQAAKVLKLSSDLERLLLSKLGEGVYRCQLKEFNEEALETIPESSLKRIRTILGFLTLKGDIKKEDVTNRISLITPLLDPEKLREKQQRRIDICDFILEEFFRRLNQQKVNEEGEKVVQFSLQGVYDRYQETHLLHDISRQDVEDALLYLSRIGAIHIEGGFLVLYNAMSLSRKTMNNNVIYKKADYKELQNYYRMKTRQVHIAGEFADLLYEQPDKALLFSKDYFSMDFEDFLNKYFDASRKKEIERNLTASRYEELFGSLSPIQQEIIQDDTSQYIAILAGPGSGKTMVLVHKLASLLLKEDVKHEQLLMLTFSRAAATEFKLRLKKLIGNGANFVEIKTFHSYCFDLMGKIGNPSDSADIVRQACDLIESEEIDTEGLYKKVLVIDEAQDMDENEYRLVRLLMEANDEMRVIMVGDDDQNIYAFRGSDARYFRDFRDTFHAKGYEMTENYRSDKAIVDFANSYAVIMENRMKTIPLTSASDQKGIVHVTEYDCPNLAEGLVRQLVRTRQGTTGVLTATNEEAMQVVTLLKENGIRARLVGTDNSFGLINLAEVRWFLKELEKEPVINKEIWDKKAEKLEKRYQRSGIIKTVLNMLRTFREVNDRIYLSDLKEFIKESQFEDFQEDKKGVVQVSTIHKAKGKEYDTVYLLLSEYRLSTPESRRVLYVGLTRARHALYIHSCNCLLPNNQHAMYTRDMNVYAEPKEIRLQLGYKDVYLDFFRDRKKDILQHVSGEELVVHSGYLTNDGKTVCVYSRSFKEQLVLLKEKGYVPRRAFIRFVVAWKGDNSKEENAVILPELVLYKENRQEETL